MQENANETSRLKLGQLETLEKRLQELIIHNDELVKENNHLLHLQRLNVEFRTFEPRLRDLQQREEKMERLEKSIEIKDSKIRELE